jgi:hypothetical protein
MGRGAVGNWR